MRAILNMILIALDLYKYVIIAAAVMSWLIAFNVVNIRNDVVRSIWNTLVALTEPLLRPHPPLPAEHRRHRYFADHAAPR